MTERKGKEITRIEKVRAVAAREPCDKACREARFYLHTLRKARKQ